MHLDIKWLGIVVAAALGIGACEDGERQSPAASAAEPERQSAGQAAALDRRSSPQGASVAFVTPRDGATVSSPVSVGFSVSGMELAPAGTDTANSGHHHLLIDTPLPDLSRPVPADARHLHFGDGSSSTELDLPPGKHTLQLLFADYLHIPHEVPVYSQQITIEVE